MYNVPVKIYGQTLKMHGFLYKHGKHSIGQISLIQRCESKIPAINYLVSIYSASRYKKFCPKCSQTPQELNPFLCLVARLIIKCYRRIGLSGAHRY